ncbi:hypothetical protein AAF712_011901 [Marasmius tenuissimus]|uniref:DUF6589 domain-containing protein n=1 Tax=Marasmius tenuissimus TaxID=585030 RepID=A0ABR2ZIT2_9AGAR
MDHIRALSAENLKIVQEIIRVVMYFLVWDNVNFAFRVESQRFDSKDHFDSGTTASLIATWDPYTKQTATHGALPLSMKPKREASNEIIQDHSPLLVPSLNDLHKPELAHLKANFPTSPPVETEQIEVHQTQHYPLPAMHEDESTIDGTLKVIETLLEKLEVTEDDLKKHGLIFADGDLLTDPNPDSPRASLHAGIPKELSSGLFVLIRRFGLFHCKMAGGRLVINEHWGKPNSPWSGSLWWENNSLLKRKSVSAGWQSKKAAPWKQTHELIQISLAAHILDGFWIHCNNSDFNAWCKTATLEDFDTTAEQVYSNLFTSHAYATQQEKPQIDIGLSNTILYNRDALFYWLFVTSIKAGNIGRVILVLRIWMIMMRTPKTMPRYADAIFETLGRIQQFPEKLQKFFLHNWLVNLTGRPNAFKENDLLQEHQNRWLKSVDAAKGPNRSWEWLSMISLCIYTLRQALLLVAKMFNIPGYGSKHTVPDMSNEVQRIADTLKEETIQEYVPERPANGFVKPVRDLLQEGMKYGERRTAFAKYRDDSGIPMNMGDQGDPVVEAASILDEGEHDGEEYEPSLEDLEMDDEEPYGIQNILLSAAMSMVPDSLN